MRATLTQVRVLLVHGAATTSTVWDGVRARLAARGVVDVVAPDRACSGSLGRELADLAPLAEGALVVGVSGGATLGLSLVAAGVPVAGAVLHEPAAGFLAPGLLAPMARAFDEGGVPAFAAALYGPSWHPGLAPRDPEAVGRDLAMFRGWDPQPLPPGHAPVLLTVGGESPEVRHASVGALATWLGVPARTVPGCRHALHLDHPDDLAALVVEVLHAPR